MSNKFLIIDIFPLLYKSYYAVSDFRNSNDRLRKNLTVFFNSLQKIINILYPDYVVCALDDKTHSYRKELFPDYKATRPQWDKSMYDFHKYALRLIKKLYLSEILFPYCEADDVVASLAYKATSDGYKTIIVSPDKDIYQVVDQYVKVLKFPNGYSSFELIGPKEVYTKFKIYPHHIADYLALAGDRADDIPGVPKIGPKTAVYLINNYGSVEDLIGNLDNIKEVSLKKKIEFYKERIQLYKKLTKITILEFNGKINNYSYKSFKNNFLNDFLQTVA
jgi:DNA polymerase-1